MFTKEELRQVSLNLIGLNALLGEFNVYIPEKKYAELEKSVEKELGFSTESITVRGPCGVVKVFPLVYRGGK